MEFDILDLGFGIGHPTTTHGTMMMMTLFFAGTSG